MESLVHVGMDVHKDTYNDFLGFLHPETCQNLI